MASRNLNLRLPIGFERPSSERPSSRTDRLVEGSFSSESPRDSNRPRLITSSSYKALSSVGKIKDIIQKTSKKLKNLQQKPEISSNAEKEFDGKNYESVRLKREVKILEMEKKELENENKKLKEEIQILREGSQGFVNSDVCITRYAKIFVSRIRENANFANPFKEFFVSEDKFLAKIGNNNFSDTTLGLLQFVLEILDKRFKGPNEDANLFSPSFAKLSKFSLDPKELQNVKNDDFSKLYKESENLRQTILIQKQKIEKVYENVKETMGMSKSISSSPTFSRPTSSLSDKNIESL